MKKTLVTTAAFVAAALLLSVSAWADDLSDDVSARRARLMERLGPDTMLILTSAPARNYSLDVDYEYRQDSNLYYLTGLAQGNTSLILMPGNAERREILFVTDRDPAQEHWRGRLLSHEEATARTGIRTVLSSGQFDATVSALLSGRPLGVVSSKEAARFFEALGAGRARVSLPMEIAPPNDPPTRTQDFARRLRERFIGFQIVDLTPALTELRLVKTPYEQRVLAQAAQISADAQVAGMHEARPGVYEYQVKAAIEAVHRGRGAVSWAYPSIVGSGPNATILHYPEGDRQMQSGDLLLVDAACNYGYMSPDITRTYPVNGTFTPAQREVYQLVLEAQDEAQKAAVPGSSLASIHDRAAAVLKAGLLRLGLITDATGDQYRMWFTHGATHYIGMDVHDVGERTRPLQPGMAFVIEPGLYIRQSALDALPRTPANQTLIEKIQPVVKKYEGLGIRVEDSFLLEESGARRLTGTAPRTIDEIEALMQKRSGTRPAGAR